MSCEIEAVLRAHAGVREVAVLWDEGGTLTAFVRASDAYLNNVLDSAAAECENLGKWQRAHDLSQRTKEAKEAAAGFNTVGWISSYTRQPVPAAEMQEWVDTAVADILRFEPRDVFEIGCGTGLLSLRIAPKCASYRASDFAPAVLDRLSEQLLATPSLRDSVRLEARSAHDFSHFNEDAVDTVILSSVVQYFPSASYLRRVLNGAVEIVRPGGRIYVGDVRNLCLFPVFSASVALFRAAHEMAVEDLRKLLRRRRSREPELLISPAFFFQFKNDTAKISEVEIRPLRGHFVTEMSQFRYQAILHVGGDKVNLPEVKFKDWTECNWTCDDLREVLRAHPKDVLGVAGIPNSRVARDVLAEHLLAAAEPLSCVGDLRRLCSASPMVGIDPQHIFDLELDELGFRVFLSWSACRHDGSYDACFVPMKLVGATEPVSISWPRPDAGEFVYMTNSPGTKGQGSELALELREHCVRKMPTERVPEVISLVDALPRRQNGEYDICSLLSARRLATWL